MIRFLLACLALLLPAAAASAAPPVRPAKDWSRTVVRNADGSFTVGNPRAPVKLVEYLSLTCPHCAAMATEADEPLMRLYIRPGRVAFTIQHALRDGWDMAGSLLARCGAPTAYYGAVQTLLVHQGEWIEKASDATLPDEGTPDAKLIAAANAAGLPALLGAKTYTPAKVAACIGDAREQKVLTAMADKAWHRPGFPGTPLFLINGREMPGLASWAALEAKIKAAK